MKILFASQNQGKQKEIRALLGNSIDLVFPQDLALESLDVEETGTSFEENAFLKAKAFASKSGLTCISDDSGLSVDALDSLPGVYSDRYFPGTAQEKNLKLLKKLGKNKNRFAQFTTVICLYDPTLQKAKYFVGEIRGSISLEAKGSEGFGYDPIFIPEGSNQTWGEMGSEEKNKNSHRSIALNKLKEYLCISHPKKS